MPQLTEAKLRSIKKSGRIERFHDSGGLYLELSAAGGKHWRWKYTWEGKEKRLSFGAWPEVSLKDAREKRDACRKALKEGENPGKTKGSPRPGKCLEGTSTFQAVAEEWVKNQKNVWVDTHAETVESRLESNVYPYIGEIPIAEVTPQDVLSLLRRIEERGALEVAKRVLGICSLVFRYGVAIGAVGSDPCRDLRGALVPRQKGQFAALTKPKDVGVFLVAIDEYKGSGVVRAALKYSALTFCRPGEIRKAEWTEIDLETKEWTIPAEKMKVRVEHRVPLSRQAIEVIESLRPLTGHGRYLFPGPRGVDKPLSENAINVSIRIMGYSKDQMTAHGFRSMASTLLNEAGHDPDVIEAQLAHTGADKIRAIYNRAQYMDRRRVLMQAWADYLDELRSSAL